MANQEIIENRRNFLTKIVPLTALMCLGCKRSAVQKLVQESSSQFPKDNGMTAEDAYSYFLGMFIPLLKSLATEIGNEKFISIIKKAHYDSIEQGVSSITKNLEKKDLRAYTSFLKEVLLSPPYNISLKYEIIEESDNVLEVRYTECLAAKLFREMNASDIGLVIECSGTKAVLKAFDSKISYTNPKNIMRGDSICTERFIYQP